MQLSKDTQAALLLTQPLLVQKGQRENATPLSDQEFANLRLELDKRGLKPRDLLTSSTVAQLRGHLRMPLIRIQGLLGRGFQLSLAREQWSARGLWAISDGDDDFPSAFVRSMEVPPPVLYGRGNPGLLAVPAKSLAIVGPWGLAKKDQTTESQSKARSRHYKRLQKEAFSAGQRAARAGYTIVTATLTGIARGAIAGAMGADGSVVAVLSGALGQAALDSYLLPGIKEGRVLVCSPNDPSMKPKVRQAIPCHRLVGAAAGTMLVLDAVRVKGPTWRGARLVLSAIPTCTVFVDSGASPTRDLALLEGQGAKVWPSPSSPEALDSLIRRNLPDSPGTQTALIPNEEARSTSVKSDDAVHSSTGQTHRTPTMDEHAPAADVGAHSERQSPKAAQPTDYPTLWDAIHESESKNGD